MRRRIIFILACICAFVLSINIVFAAGSSSQTDDSVAVVFTADGNKTYYDTFNDAVEGASNGDTIALLKSVQLSRGESAVSIDKDVILTSNDPSKPCAITGIIGEKGSLLTIDAEVMMTDIIVDGTEELGRLYGSLVAVKGGKLTLEDGSVLKDNYDNRGSAFGGGVSVVGGSLVMEPGSLITNCFSDNGGGVSIMDGEFIMNGGEISGCDTIKYGGGIYMGSRDAVFTMNSGIISDNKADSGGGIMIEGGTLTIESGDITKNTATDFGGGGLAMGHQYTGGSSPIIYTKVNINGGNITENTAEVGGGGILMVNGDAYMTGGSVSRNISEGNAGGVYVGTHTDGKFNMSGGTISNNTALVNGGGVYYGGSDVVFNLSNGASIIGNAAQNGGGVDIRIGGKFNSDGGIISNNTAARYGGGVYYEYGGTLTMENDSELSGNTAQYGGAAFMGSGVVISYDSNITENEATNVGGAIYCNGGQILLDNSIVANNSAASNGGIYSTPNTKVLIVAGNTVFSGNTGGDAVGNHIQVEYQNGKTPITIGQLGDDASIPVNVKNYSADPSLLNLLIGIPRTLKSAAEDEEAVYYTLTGRDVSKFTVEDIKYMASLEDDNKVYLKYTINVTLSEETAVYDGDPHYPEIAVTDYSGNILKEGTDYKVFFYDKDGKQIDKSNMISAGEYDIKIEPVNEDMANVWKEYTIGESAKPDDSEEYNDLQNGQDNIDSNDFDEPEKSDNDGADDSEVPNESKEHEKPDIDSATDSGDDFDLAALLGIMMFAAAVMTATVTIRKRG